MDSRDKLSRQVSRLYNTGGDPYNTADSIRVSRELSQDFVEWVRSLPETTGETPSLMRRQAD